MMCDRQRAAAWAVWLGCALSVAATTAADGGDGSFLLYAPSGAEQRLLVVRARPTKEGVSLEMARTVPLGFPGSTITFHATRPWLYVTGGRGAGGSGR